MILRSLRLQNMRAHVNSVVTLAPNINLLYGPNGAGKTNIIEAVHYLCLAKSFLTNVERYVIQRGQPFFEIEGKFEGSLRKEVVIRVAVVAREGKRMFINGSALERLADVVGVVPLVVFAPSDQQLTYGGPEERRKFLNSVLSQARPSHLEDLIGYRRALKQRNEYLATHRNRQIDHGLIVSMNAVLARLGGRIIVQRSAFLKSFNQELQCAWKHLGEVIEEPFISYQGPISESDQTTPEKAEDALLETLMQSMDRDIEYGRTTLGPHRDELVFKLDQQEVRRFGSTGQHRSFAIALKMAQFHYLDSRLEEKPLLLLDDLFDSLDPARTDVIMNWLNDSITGQSLLTAADAENLRSKIEEWGTPNQCIQVQGGRVIQSHAEE